ncbi:Alpha/Beta hydrolase protein [Amylocarpus encephaloides]|uniref:Alpha/Beta hydrolase protein n=1 Tax=Amylocarpus encephaloides TaxID=45428 RepID=A0A9P8C8X1_9HELO|nr:Alpha/Beta hydrolase protein [Amylocarpus encephaloides]
MDALLHLQGDPESPLTPFFLIHAISGLALPYLALGSLSDDSERPVYGISSPTYEFKSYTLPSTLDSLAAEYVNLIRREVQPKGPYLLGGWSMGGMIAMRMAALLESQGEKVLQVVLVDSSNPETIPPFATKNEHEILTSLTFSHVSRGLEMPGCPPLNRNDSDSSIATTSCSSSDERFFNPIQMGASTPDSEICSEEELYDEEYDDDDDDFEDDDAVNMMEWPSRMRKHIFNGLSLIACKNAPSKYGPVIAQVTLIKCASLDKLPPLLSDTRRHAIQKLFRDSKSGWRLPQFRTLLINSAHDHVLDAEHAEELTEAFRKALKSVKH